MMQKRATERVKPTVSHNESINGNGGRHFLLLYKILQRRNKQIRQAGWYDGMISKVSFIDLNSK